MTADEACLLHGVKHLFEEAGRNASSPCNCLGLNRGVTVM
jgi:hypothetical protein